MPQSNTEERFAKIQKRLAQAYHGRDDASLVTRPFPLNAGHVPDDYPHATEITLNRDMQNFSPFLSLVNVLPRTHQKGGSLGIGSQGRVTKTNDTKAGNARRPSVPKDAKPNEYEMVKAHADFSLHDDDIDAMSEFDDWEDEYRASFMEAMSNDRIIIGWHGTHHAKTSNLSDHPLLEDVNKGWFALLEERASSQVMTGGKTAGEIKIGTGEGNDYASLDHLVQDMYQGIPMHRRTPGMAAAISETLMGFAEGSYYREAAGTPSEKPRIKEKAVSGVYGGLDSLQAPYLPQTGIVITGWKRNGQRRSNLSIYWQKDSWRRSVEYQAKLESSIDWNARREAYHIENLQAMVALKVEKIIFTDLGKDDSGNWIGEFGAIPENKWAEQ